MGGVPPLPPSIVENPGAYMKVLIATNQTLFMEFKNLYPLLRNSIFKLKYEPGEGAVDQNYVAMCEQGYLERPFFLSGVDLLRG